MSKSKRFRKGHLTRALRVLAAQRRRGFALLAIIGYLLFLASPAYVFAGPIEGEFNVSQSGSKTKQTSGSESKYAGKFTMLTTDGGTTTSQTSGSESKYAGKFTMLTTDGGTATSQTSGSESKYASKFTMLPTDGGTDTPPKEEPGFWQKVANWVDKKIVDPVEKGYGAVKGFYGNYVVDPLITAYNDYLLPTFDRIEGAVDAAGDLAVAGFNLTTYLAEVGLQRAADSVETKFQVNLDAVEAGFNRAVGGAESLFTWSVNAAETGVTRAVNAVEGMVTLAAKGMQTAHSFVGWYDEKFIQPFINDPAGYLTNAATHVYDPLVSLLTGANLETWTHVGDWDARQWGTVLLLTGLNLFPIGKGVSWAGRGGKTLLNRGKGKAAQLLNTTGLAGFGAKFSGWAGQHGWATEALSWAEAQLRKTGTIGSLTNGIRSRLNTVKEWNQEAKLLQKTKDYLELNLINPLIQDRIKRLANTTKLGGSIVTAATYLKNKGWDPVKLPGKIAASVREHDPLKVLISPVQKAVESQAGSTGLAAALSQLLNNNMEARSAQAILERITDIFRKPEAQPEQRSTPPSPWKTPSSPTQSRPSQRAPAPVPSQSAKPPVPLQAKKTTQSAPKSVVSKAQTTATKVAASAAKTVTRVVARSAQPTKPTKSARWSARRVG